MLAQPAAQLGGLQQGEGAPLLPSQQSAATPSEPVSDPICNTWGWTPGSPPPACGSCSGGADDPLQAAFLFCGSGLRLPTAPGFILGSSSQPAGS